MSKILTEIIGSTVLFTWINSGVSMSPTIAVYNRRTHVLVDSATMSDSGDGHYFHHFTLPTSGSFAARMVGALNGREYVRSASVVAVTGGFPNG